MIEKAMAAYSGREITVTQKQLMTPDDAHELINLIEFVMYLKFLPHDGQVVFTLLQVMIQNTMKSHR